MKIQIHQILHGYREGHCMLASSITLPNLQDIQKMDSLSDWSEFVSAYGDSTYITIYPLEQSGYYVIAKSWYAEEMPRPGCVWTHSLVLKTTDLKYISDFYALNDFFRRPTHDDYESYEHCIEFEVGKNLTVDGTEDYMKCLCYIYRRLMNSTSQCYLIENTSDYYQSLCLKILNLLPYPILNDFSLCSGTSNIRNFGKEQITIQFVSSNLPNADHLLSPQNIKGDTLNEYLQSLFVSYDFNFVLFIKKFSIDIYDCKRLTGAIEIYSILDRTYKDDIEKEMGMSEILRILATEYPQKGEGSSIKKQILQQNVTSCFVDEVGFLSKMCTNDYENSIGVDNVCFNERYYAIAKTDKSSYIKLLGNLFSLSDKSKLAMQYVRSCNTFLSDWDIYSIQANNVILYDNLLSVCPNILRPTLIVGLSKESIRKRVLVILKSKFNYDYWQYLIKSIIEKDITLNVDIWIAINNIESRTKYIVLDRLKSKDDIDDSIIQFYMRDKYCVLDWMKSHDNHGTGITKLAMALFKPNDSILILYGSKLWRPVCNNGYGRMSLGYYSYLYILSFSFNEDDITLELLKHSFYYLYKAAEDDRMPSAVWDALYPYVEKSPKIFSWDKCKMMRKRVARRLAKSIISKQWIESFTPDKALNKYFLKVWQKAHQ